MWQTRGDAYNVYNENIGLDEKTLNMFESNKYCIYKLCFCILEMIRRLLICYQFFWKFWNSNSLPPSAPPTTSLSFFRPFPFLSQ